MKPAGARRAKERRGKERRGEERKEIRGKEPSVAFQWRRKAIARQGQALIPLLVWLNKVTLWRSRV